MAARTADYRQGEVVSIPVDPPTGSVVATVCLRNRGRSAIALEAVQDRRRSRSAIDVDGTAAPVSWTLQFAERDPVSIFERFPDSVRRMTVLRPGFVSEVTLWGLIVLFLTVPALAIWAFARALRDDGD